MIAPRFPTRTALVGLATWVLAAAPSVHAQEEGTQEPSVEELVQTELRILDRRSSGMLEREASLAMLLELDALGPYRLAHWVEGELRSLRRSYATKRKKHVRDVERVGPKILHKRMTREVQQEIETLRAQIRSNARDGGLTKETIHASSDPAWKRLEEILTITPQQMWDEDEALYEDVSELLDLLETEAIYVRYHAEARQRLEELGEEGTRWLPKLATLDPQAETPGQLMAFLTTLAETMTPMSDRARKILADNATKRDQLDGEEYDGILFLNRMRILFGMHPYAIDVKLCKAARGHSNDMKEHGFFSHTSPIPGKETPGKRAALEGTSGGAENIARGATKGQGSIMQWWYSPGHHRNMLGGASRIGLGRVETFWTQMFG
ncbi:MAG: hypothetical protein H6834_10980 [Planctomycetes bacterium]|nr:hypothetical protein [Planctomycetota bacterium]MCB9891738.1 hypothetical protein [Planctomycetota bacterium]